MANRFELKLVSNLHNVIHTKIIDFLYIINSKLSMYKAGNIVERRPNNEQTFFNSVNDE